MDSFKHNLAICKQNNDLPDVLHKFTFVVMDSEGSDPVMYTGSPPSESVTTKKTQQSVTTKINS